MIDEDDGWIIYNEVGEARTRGNIGREAGRLSGNKELSVKRPPIPTIPLDAEAPLIYGVPPDVLHARMRVGDKLMSDTLFPYSDLIRLERLRY